MEALADTTNKPVIDGRFAQVILEELASWGKTTTIIIHHGCVFEYKGCFPQGKMGQGFYNLDSQGNGFEGHLNLERITAIELESKLHRGRQAYALVFKGDDNELIFKVFVGRDDNGELFTEQVKAFEKLAVIYIEQGGQ